MNLRFQITRLLSSGTTGVLTLSVVLALPWTSAAGTNEVLTTASAVLSLTPSQAAQRISVSVTGVVTVAEPNWEGKFFVQDSTGGVFVKNESEPKPILGDLVTVSGFGHPGGYAPDIDQAHWKKLGTAPLPEARPVSVERLMSGVEDGQRIEVSAVVRSARQSQIVRTRMVVELASGGYRFRAFPPLSANVDPNSLVGATVRVRGTAAASFNRPLRDIVTAIMFVPRESDFIVDRLPATPISQEPLTPLNGIAKYRRNSSPESRVRVEGTVTYQRPGKDIFLQNESGALQVKCRETNTFAPGEIVEAIGFPNLQNFLPVLDDATLIRTKESRKTIVPEKVAIPRLFSGFHHSELICLQGMLLDHSVRPLPTANSLSNTLGERVLTLKSDRYFLSVEAPATQRFAQLASIPIGSTLEVCGICFLEAGNEGTTIETVQILLPDAPGIRILQRPSWWTTKRLLAGLGSLLGVSLLGAIWSIMILRKNSALKSSIAEKLLAQEELKKAHDLLEWRVQERTKELNFEMSARKEAEVRVDAIVEERKRIAQELHDTLLQGFTGIGLKLDALASALPESLSPTKEQLEAILEKSDEYMTEARRSVWKLRSPSLEKHADFPTALMRVSERAVEGTGTRLMFLVEGTVRTAEHDIEGNLLRICEEAVANAVKHAHPTQVEVNLQYAAKELRLRIRDNGCGFNPDGPEGEKVGHFGLAGIGERAKSLAGNMSLKSRPGQGTEIIVRLPCLNGSSRPSTADVHSAVGPEL